MDKRILRDKDGEGHMSDKVTIIMPKQQYEISRREFYEVLSFVPIGMITCREDIVDFIVARDEYYNPGCTKNCIVCIEKFPTSIFGVPLWRLVTKYGWLVDTRYCSITEQEKMLREEGLSVEPCGPNGRSRQVVDYREHWFDWSGEKMKYTHQFPEF